MLSIAGGLVMAKINIKEITIYCSSVCAGVIYENNFNSFDCAFQVLEKLSKNNSKLQTFYLLIEL